MSKGFFFSEFDLNSAFNLEREFDLSREFYHDFSLSKDNRRNASKRIKKITIDQLSYEEREDLKFGISSLIMNEWITPKQEKFIYNNLYRGIDGRAYAYIDFVDREKLVPIS